MQEQFTETLGHDAGKYTFCLQQNCLILNENWWEEMKEQKSYEQSIRTLSATESGKVPGEAKRCYTSLHYAQPFGCGC